MKFLLSSILIFSFFSCKDNPYPNNGEIEQTPRREQRDIPPAIGLIMENQYKLFEGREKVIQLKATVPEPGLPRIEVKNLPAGASFNEETFELTWTPGFFDGNDIEDPSIKTRDYTVGIYLRSSIGDIKAEYYEMLLTVVDTPQNFAAIGRDKVSVIEGDKLSYNLRVENFDYPNGPFKVTAENLPAGAKIEKVDEINYRIVFKPDFQHVILGQRNDCQSAYRNKCINYKAKIFVHNPANHITTKDVEIEVKDKRLSPQLVIPPTVTQGLDSSFQVSSYDMNADVAPEMSISPSNMDYGDFKTELIRDEKTKSSVLNVSWRDIPPSYNGETVSFDVKSCVYNNSLSFRNCVSDKVKLKIVLKDRKAPIIDRSLWPIGKTIYLKYNERRSFTVKAFDGDNTRLNIKKREVFPVEMREHVSWQGNRLIVSFDTPGRHQFSLKATSEYNMSSAESFVVEVFEKDRSKTLYFTDSTRGDEVAFFKTVIKDVRIMNPALQALDERILSGRDNLIIGTDILIDKSMRSPILSAMNKIDNVIVATSLIENMPQPFIDELQLHHNISLLGKFNDLNLSQKLTDMHFIARRDFEQGDTKVYLKGNSTIFSSNPLIFSVGVDRNDCEDILDLTDKKEEQRLKIGVICDRKKGGRYAILGTEFSDIKPSSQDKGIVKKWLDRMISTSLDGDY